VNVWTGFDWLSIRPKSELLRKAQWTFGLYKSIYLLTRRAALDFQTRLLPVSVLIVKPGKESHGLAPCTSPFIYYAHHCSYLAIRFTRMLILITTSWLSLATVDLDWLVEGNGSFMVSRRYRGIFEGIQLDFLSDYFLWPRRTILLNSVIETFFLSWGRQDQPCSCIRLTLVRRLYRLWLKMKWFLVTATLREDYYLWERKLSDVIRKYSSSAKLVMCFHLFRLRKFTCPSYIILLHFFS